MKKIFEHELLRYMLVGGCSTFVDFVIYKILTVYAGLSIYHAFFVSFPCGVLVNFIFCNRYVFSQQRCLPLWRSVLRHYSASIGGFLMQFSLFYCLMSWVVFPYPLIARIIAAGCTFILNFLIIKRFVFGQ